MDKERWKTISLKILARDGFKCRRCGSREHLTIHHIVPRKRGGKTEPRNLITLCKKCHDYVELRELQNWEAITTLKYEQEEPSPRLLLEVPKETRLMEEIERKMRRPLEMRKLNVKNLHPKEPDKFKEAYLVRCA